MKMAKQFCVPSDVVNSVKDRVTNSLSRRTALLGVNELVG